MKTPLKITALITFLLGFLATDPAGATTYNLTVYAQGSGTVIPNNTNNPHPANANITITASPNPGWYFSDWSGNASGAANPLIVTMTSDLVITGNFLAYPTYQLTLITNGQGTIALNPAGGAYLSNTVVTATATPAAGWVFTDWSGATNGTANPTTFAVNASSSLTGSFAQLPAFDVQPVSLTNATGSTVSFSAHSVGTAPLAYQWFFSGGSLPNANATNTTLSLTNTTAAQAGNYWVVATNAYGNATSSLASLTLTNQAGPTNVVGTASEASLRAALALGGWVGIQFNGPLTVANTIYITNNVVLDGTTVAATLSGGNAVRLFYVTNGASLTISNLTLANGNCLVANGPADAGAIYNRGTVTLIGCTLTNNMAQATNNAGLARGGAIFNNGGTVLLLQSAISNNAAIGGTGSPSYANGWGLGGAIYNTNGSVTLQGCTISSNLCEGLCQQFSGIDNPGSNGLSMGGAVYQASGSLTILNSSVGLNLALGGSAIPFMGLGGPNVPSAAYGGALAVTGGSATINLCQFNFNEALGGSTGGKGPGASGFGGALYSTAALTIVDSTLSGNQSVAGASAENNTIGTIDGFGGAIYNAGTLAINGCFIGSNNAQGGFLNISLFFPPTTGFRGLGGGIFNAAQLTATNCTIAFNSAIGGLGDFSSPSDLGTNGNAMGGGVFNNTNATFIGMALTIASNNCLSPTSGYLVGSFTAGYQIANTNGTLSLHNSLLAGTNSAAYGPITDGGYNICSDASAALNSGSSYDNTDPQLAPLGNYGGPTLCMALLASSPAIDTGDPADFPPVDQRGYARPADSGPDMGAYEYDAVFIPVPTLGFGTSGTTGTNFTFSFTAYPGKTYVLQSSTNLVTWSNVTTNGPITVQTNLNQSLPKPSLGHGYFRLWQQ